MKESNKKRKAFARRLILVLIGLILGVNVYLANARGILGNALPMPFGYGSARFLSGSMEPEFSKGTLLLVKETTDVEVNDIIVYQSDNMLITHRVIERNGSTVITKGDANNVADEPFDQSQVKGKVIGWVPGLGAVAELIKKPVVSILLFLAAVYLSESAFRKDREEDERKKELLKEEIRRLKEERGN